MATNLYRVTFDNGVSTEVRDLTGPQMKKVRERMAQQGYVVKSSKPVRA